MEPQASTAFRRRRWQTFFVKCGRVCGNTFSMARIARSR